MVRIFMTNEDKLKELQANLKVIEAPVKKLKKEIQDLKATINKANDDVKYKDFDPLLKDFYTYKLPSKRGDDWTDLTGWHGANTRKEAAEIESLFDTFQVERYQEFDVYEELFECGVLSNYFDGEDFDTDKLYNYKGNPDLLKTFDGLPNSTIDKIKNFIRIYKNIKVNSCLNDW